MEIEIGTIIQLDSTMYPGSYARCEVIDGDKMKCVESSHPHWAVGDTGYIPSTVKFEEDNPKWKIVSSKSTNFNSLYEKLADI